MLADTSLAAPRGVAFGPTGDLFVSGPGCAIPGEATEERGLLLRGMGLELALRTMQFDHAIDNVAVFPYLLPKGKT